MTPPVDPRLRRLLGAEELAPLRRRLRRQYERNPAELPRGPMRLSGLTPVERTTLCGLLGRPDRPGASLRFDLAEIDTALANAGIAPTLRRALEMLGGPIVDRAAVRSELAQRWARSFAGAADPCLRSLLDTGAGQRLLRRLAGQMPERAAELCARADAVLAMLPVDGMPRSRLAALTLGDAHALDAGAPTATLVLAAWRSRQSDPRLRMPECEGALEGADSSTPSAGSEDTTPAAATTADDDDGTAPNERPDETIRDAWASCGVLVNELARPALVLNLPREWATHHGTAPGAPAYLSLRALLRSQPSGHLQGQILHVCENPNLVAIAADELGIRCAPLISTDGMPAAAQHTLLTQLVQAGARLRYHGDFDWPGLRIANHVIRRFAALPWRMSAEDYRIAVQAASQRSAEQQAVMIGGPVTACWDAGLDELMQKHRIAIAEEAVAEGLMDDLRGTPSRQ